jgi:hypothetical protein
VRIWPIEGRNDEANLVTPALEARNPCIPITSNGPAGALPAEQAGVSLSRKGVLVTALGADPDAVNQGTLLRVWEQAGHSGELVVTLPAGADFTTAQPVNLRGEKTGAALNIEDGTLTVNLGAYAPASYVLNK